MDTIAHRAAQAPRGSVGQPGGAYPLQSRAGGNFSEWVRRIRGESGEPLSEAGDAMKWFYGVCEREGRVDRLVNCLLRIEKTLQDEVAGVRAEADREKAKAAAAANEVAFVRRVLNSRDRQFSALQAEVLSARRDWMWRAVRKARCAVRRAREMLGVASGRGQDYLAGAPR